VSLDCGEDVDEVGITQLISTGPALITPALSVSRFRANNFSSSDRLFFLRGCKMNPQIHNSYYYCYSFLEI
jgi:hypothetical protein